MIALIDGDIIIYSCGFAAQKNVYSVVYNTDDGKYTWEVVCEGKREATKLCGELDGVMKCETMVEPVENALHSAKMLLRTVLEDTEATDYRLFLSGSTNFRDDIVDYYKQNRDPDFKPEHYEALRQYLINVWQAEVVEGQEADDAMGINHTPDTILCTIDKDMDNIAGLHYNWRKDKKPRMITQEEADNNFYIQLVTGDSVDNIPGLYKLTGQKATKKVKEEIKVRSDVYDKWRYVCELYAAGGVEEEEVVKLAQLLWIRREEGEYWKPPQQKAQETKSSEEVHGSLHESEDSGKQEVVQTQTEEQ